MSKGPQSFCDATDPQQINLQQYYLNQCKYYSTVISLDADNNWLNSSFLSLILCLWMCSSHPVVTSSILPFCHPANKNRLETILTGVSWCNARHLVIGCKWLTSSAVIGRNSKLTGVGLFPGDDTELDVGDSGNWNAVVHGYKQHHTSHFNSFTTNTKIRVSRPEVYPHQKLYENSSATDKPKWPHNLLDRLNGNKLSHHTDAATEQYSLLPQELSTCSHQHRTLSSKFHFSQLNMSLRRWNKFSTSYVTGGK